MMFVSIGFDNYINKNEVIAIVSSNTFPSKRMIKEAKKLSLLVDATAGRKANTLLVTKSGHIVLSHKMKESIGQRFNKDV